MRVFTLAKKNGEREAYRYGHLETCDHFHDSFVYRNDSPKSLNETEVYLLLGVPVVLSDKLTCLDFCAAKGNPLVAYRWGGES